MGDKMKVGDNLTVIRASKDSRKYLIVPIEIIEDGRISADAFRLLLMTASLSPSWRHFTIEGLLKIFVGSGKTKNRLYKCWKELKAFGYVTEEKRERKSDGTYGAQSFIVRVDKIGETDKEQLEKMAEQRAKRKKSTSSKSRSGGAMENDGFTTSSKQRSGVEKVSAKNSQFGEKVENTTTSSFSRSGESTSGKRTTTQEYITQEYITQEDKSHLFLDGSGEAAEIANPDEPLKASDDRHMQLLKEALKKANGAEPTDMECVMFCMMHPTLTIGAAIAEIKAGR